MGLPALSGTQVQRCIRLRFGCSADWRSLLHKLYFFLFAGLGIGRFVGMTECDTVNQLVAFAETQFLQVGRSIGVSVDETYGATQTARTYAHTPSGKNHVLAQ